MKVGIFVTNQNPLGTDMVSALDEQFAMTRLARDRGWDAVGTGQHYLSEGMSQLQLIPFLARLAAEAGEMTGVAGVLLINLHNPVEVAECIASLDVIWRGNFVFGVGLGYREVEFDAFKVPKGQRLRRFEECLEIVKRLWTEDKVSVETDVCTLANVTLTCRPVQKPHPPIWFAANNDAAVRRAARLGDAWFVNPHATMASITRQMGLYREELARLGRPLPGVRPLIKEILREGPADGPGTGRAISRCEVPCVRIVGPGRGAARRGHVPPAVRGAPARPLRAGQPGGMLRTAPPVLGSCRRELPLLPHALARHAAGPRAGQHATHER